MYSVLICNIYIYMDTCGFGEGFLLPMVGAEAKCLVGQCFVRRRHGAPCAPQRYAEPAGGAARWGLPGRVRIIQVG